MPASGGGIDKENTTMPSTSDGQEVRDRPGRKRGAADLDNEESESAIGLGPRKRPPSGSPRAPFGRTIQAFCRVQTLIKNGMARDYQLRVSQDIAEEDLSPQEFREHQIYKDLLALSPGLEKRLCTGSDEDIFHVAELIQKGSSTARADDTKGLKGVILDWITPLGEALRPPLTRNVKTDRGFYHETTGKLLCPVGLDWSDTKIREGLRLGTITVAGDQWPLFLYRDYRCERTNVWEGLFQSVLLVSAFKHIFTSPSSVDREPRATRSGNARIHGMTKVTIPSLAYVATQVRFALSSSPVFSRTDLVTDSERFYGSVIEAFNDPREKENVCTLLNWWNSKIFPAQSTTLACLKEGSVLALMREQRNSTRSNDTTLQIRDSNVSTSTAVVADSRMKLG
ncbi:hypothetical protein BKA70DRAFT_1370398 [Coprinopsis sp. MPI-PUGE-AT-0042]|nr:hypothetical protein BKA70DRAFT_1370398 [Coprinopsis sp. MPI-PUGE-AT-0042]